MAEKIAESRTSKDLAECSKLIGRRWTLRILWELRDRRCRSTTCAGRGGMSQSVLVTRLTELSGPGSSRDVAGGYELTPTVRL